MRKKGRCEICLEIKELTLHSLNQHHIPPYAKLCLECHRKLHNSLNYKYSKEEIKLMKKHRLT